MLSKAIFGHQLEGRHEFSLYVQVVIYFLPLGASSGAVVGMPRCNTRGPGFKSPYGASGRSAALLHRRLESWGLDLMISKVPSNPHETVIL